MTGEKDRFTTHEKLWKLEDGELSTPKHDELVLHLLNKNNTSKILESIGITPYYSITPKLIQEDSIINNITRFMSSYIVNNKNIKDIIYENVSKYISNSFNYMHSLEIDNKIYPSVASEVPISTQNGFIVGYVDIRIEYTQSYSFEVMLPPYEFSFTYDELVLPGEPTKTEEKIVSIDYKGSMHLSNNCYNNTRKNIIINVEVKPQIRSFGETLRQINTYKVYDPTSIYVIYSPDTRFKAAFESQGVIFITPSDLGLKLVLLFL